MLLPLKRENAAEGLLLLPLKRENAAEGLLLLPLNLENTAKAPHGVPPSYRRSEGTVEPRRGGRMAGQGPFAYFWGCLPKVSRRKGGTRRRPSHIKRICTRLLNRDRAYISGISI